MCDVSFLRTESHGADKALKLGRLSCETLTDKGVLRWAQFIVKSHGQMERKELESVSCDSNTGINENNHQIMINKIWANGNDDAQVMVPW
jgi:hypothetical protein